MDYLCGKSLAPILAEVVPLLKKHKEIRVDKVTERKLLTISAATIDRLLKPERKKFKGKGRSLTKPGTLLKHQIPIRTFSEWNEQKPGFVEIDLVGHDGGNSSGEFSQTLTVADVCTGWTDVQAVKNKAQCWVFEAVKDIRDRLPFDLLGIDSDNGAEFINDQLYRYCVQEKITFTRARSHRKNDNCFVEQTPYQRVPALLSIPDDINKWLKREHGKLNPAELKRNIERLQNKLISIAAAKRKRPPHS